MIEKINKACTRMNQQLGVPISLPRPNQAALKLSAFCNLIIGLILAGIGFSFGIFLCGLLGLLVIAGGVILIAESYLKSKW